MRISVISYELKVVYWHQTPDGLNLMRPSIAYLYIQYIVGHRDCLNQKLNFFKLPMYYVYFK